MLLARVIFSFSFSDVSPSIFFVVQASSLRGRGSVESDGMLDCLINAGGKHPGLCIYYYRYYYGFRVDLAEGEICMWNALRISLQIRSVYTAGVSSTCLH